MVGLGDLPGGFFNSSANGVSGDGSVVVGLGISASGAEAFIWDSTSGMRSLQEVLILDHALGPVLSGWTLSGAFGISDDGFTIVGNGRNPSGQIEAWIVSLRSDPPECSGAAALGVQGIMLKQDL